jgi:hypothetical protein
MMAFVNTAGVHIPIWLDALTWQIGWGQNSAFPFQEGTFFGNIITTGSLAGLGKPQVSGPAAYYCDGDGFATGINGEVAGRLGAGSWNAPYQNPFGNGVLCKNSARAVGQWSNGTNNANGTRKDPDGYSSLYTNTVAWNNAITVWRSGSYTPVFDSGYRYVLFALSGGSSPVVLDTGSSPVGTQPIGSGLATSRLIIAPAGANWTISPMNAPSMCLDAGDGTANSQITLQSCQWGDPGQQWTITPHGNSYGAFTIAIATSGNVLAQVGNAFNVQSYAGSNTQLFRIQAVLAVD